MFKYLIVISPLGLLYGSAGPFLSPENLVGRAGNRFPPSSATLSGIYAATYKQEEIKNLYLAGPFWAPVDNPHNFFVPTPFIYLVNKPLADYFSSENQQEQGKIKHKLVWQPEGEKWQDSSGQPISGKFEQDSWIPISEWKNPKKAYQAPWKYTPHLHPRLALHERKVDQNKEQGSLFLENSVQLHPEACLIYLSNQPLPNNQWYRFGGEGHLVEIQTLEFNDELNTLFNEPVKKYFALITPGIWGSHRFSHREPIEKQDNNWQKIWSIKTQITERPIPYRYRLGGKEPTKRLSRGRYAVPAGTVYLLENPISQPWVQWSEDWFPKEGYSLKRWGCGLALPLPEQILFLYYFYC